MKALEKHYTVAEVALLLGFSERWVRERIQDGSFGSLERGASGPVQIGGTDWRVPASAINAYVERWRQEPVEPKRRSAA